MSDQLSLDALLSPASSPGAKKTKSKKTGLRSDQKKISKMDSKAEVIKTESEENKDAVSNNTDKEPKVYSVSQLNKAIKDTLEDGFALIWIKAEISNFKVPPSGHFYFSLKDAKSQVRAVMFKGFNSRLKFKPADGMEVLVRARVSVYAPRGDYQLICEVMDPVGQGALQMAFEQLKKKLQSEGLFDPKIKKVIPPLPKKIALVTSPTGAAVRDMLNVLGRRYKGVEIFIVPTSVQGAQAPGEIVKAIELASKIKDLDVMIVGRGGGSIEDLWSFNEEIVARAIANSHVPIISAVGHEVDFTISDFVADLRAPTPSAAAELVAKNTAELLDTVIALRKNMVRNIQSRLQLEKQYLVGLSKRLVDPQKKLSELVQRCDDLVQRLESSFLVWVKEKKSHIRLLKEKLGSPQRQIQLHSKSLEYLRKSLEQGISEVLEKKKSQLSQKAAVLDSISPLRILDRGFSIATKENRILKSVSEVNVKENISVQLSDGKLEAQINKINPK